MMIEDMPQDKKVKLHIYADDITITCSGKHMEEVKASMQHYLNQFTEWCRVWGLCINPEKTYCQMFTRKRIQTPILRIENRIIEHKKEK